jgi:hypothetical protein
MANYESIMRLRPEVREFVRNRRWVHRGDVLFYGPNISAQNFSTDGGGFRHSVFRGKTLSVAEIVREQRFGLVLGPSSVYGFGLAGNEHTMPSLLGEKFGFPFANIGLPEGNSRNLFSILVAMMSRRQRRPSAVVHISGGDYTSFCYTSIADPVFGPPNLKQIPLVMKERRNRRPTADTQIKPLLSFTSTWIRSIGRLCKASRIPLVLADDTTFFEKANPNQVELDSELGKPFNANQELQFATHKRFANDYHSRRRAVADRLGVPLAGPGLHNDIGFVDEFHYDRDGTRALVEDYARALEPLL